jgi:hypothetical protein
LYGWIILLAFFLLIQIVILFVFYRVVLKPLPAQINELLFSEHFKSCLAKTAEDTAELVRAKLLELESERLEALSKYEALKGRRGLTTTERNEREGLKKTCDQLDRQIKGFRGQLGSLYSVPVLAHLRKFEGIRFVAAINKYLDTRTQS